MKKKQGTLLLKTIYAMIAVVIFAQSLGIPTVSSVAFYCIMLLSVAFWFFQAQKKLTKPELLTIFVVMLACVNVLVDGLLHMELLEGADFVKIASFVLALLYFSALSQYRANRKLVEYLFRLNTLIALYCLAICLVNWRQMHLYNNIDSRYLTLRFSNPNLTAIFLLCCTLMELIRTNQLVKKKKKVFHLALSCGMIFLLWQTRSRNCLIALMAFLVVFLWLRFFSRKKQPRMSGPVIACVVLGPLVLAIVYMLVVYSPGFNQLFSFLLSDGKRLDSRYTIWQYAWSVFFKSPLIGSFSQVLHGTSQFHMHNSHLDILASYGLPILALFCLLEYRLLATARNGATTRTAQLAVWAFGALMLTGMGEVAIFSGGLGIYAYVGIFLLVAGGEGTPA